MRRAASAGAILGVLALGCQAPAPSPPAAPVPAPPTAVPAPPTAVTVPPIAAPSAAEAGGTACPVGPDFAAAFALVSPCVVGVVAGRRDGDRLVAQRSGSGFVWDEQGHVVTNDHLLGESNAVAVRFEDGRALAAKVVGRDPPTDLAVLSVRAADLHVAPRGDADGLVPGTWVAAIGNPMGMDHSISVGVVSATGRRNLPGRPSRYLNFIQTDVNLNPGSSGGPLVDGRGRVVGLNTAVLAGTQGIAFATPVDLVTTVVTDILQNGRFIRGFAGIVVKPVQLRDASAAGLEHQQGAWVEKIVSGGPGSVAGLHPGDIILQFGDKPIDEPDVLPWLIAATKPGTTVELHVARKAERLTVPLKVAQAK